MGHGKRILLIPHVPIMYSVSLVRRMYGLRYPGMRQTRTHRLLHLKLEWKCALCLMMGIEGIEHSLFYLENQIVLFPTHELMDGWMGVNIMVHGAKSNTTYPQVNSWDENSNE